MEPLPHVAEHAPASTHLDTTHGTGHFSVLQARVLTNAGQAAPPRAAGVMM